MVRWLIRATRLLRSIHARIAVDDPTAAKRLVQHIRQRTERLSEFPASGRLGRIAGSRELVVHGLPYVIVYRIQSEQVQILRVFHTAIDWPAVLD